MRNALLRDAETRILARLLAGVEPAPNNPAARTALLGMAESAFGGALLSAALMANGRGAHQGIADMLATLDPCTRDAVQRQIAGADPLAPATNTNMRLADRFALRTTSLADPQMSLPEELIGAFVRRSAITLVVGAPGRGKTWILLHALVAAALGHDWLGLRVKHSRVLVVDEESGPRRLQHRLQAVLRGHDAPPTLQIPYFSLEGLNLRDPAEVDALSNAIAEIQADIVLIDALADIAPGADENSVKDMQPVLQGLRFIAEQQQCGIVLLHHTSKAGGYRGSSAIAGAVDLLVEVNSKPDEPHMTIEVVKCRDGEPFRLAAVAHFGAGMFRLSSVGAPPKRERLSRAEDYVVRRLREHGRQHMSAIKHNADACSGEAARQAVYRLVRRKIVRRCNSGGQGIEAEYELTRDPERADG